MRLIFFGVAFLFFYTGEATARRIEPSDASFGALVNDSHASKVASEAYGAYLACVKNGGNCQPPAHLSGNISQYEALAEKRVLAILAGKEDPGASTKGDGSTR